MGALVLEIRDISKSFPGVQALKQVSFSIRQGEIVSLLGENGAGKSTLVRILAGVHQPDCGTILLDGLEVQLRNTADAIARGISIVFQEFNLCPNLSAMENLFLGQELRGPLGLLSHRQMREKARAAFAQLNIGIEPDALVRDLGVAQQQMVEVAKALSHRTRILIMDEPTSALAEEGVARLFTTIRQLRDRGISVLFISHRLNEVLEVTDRVVCLKDGQNSGEIQTRSADQDCLVSMMVGRSLDGLYAQRRGKPSDEIALEVRNFSRRPKIREVSFKICRGEILGLAGLIGAGRTEVARLIIGADKKSAGQLFLDGVTIDVRHPADALAHRIGYVPEDRKRLGLVLGMNVRENSTMTIHARLGNRFGLIRRAVEEAVANDQVRKLQIRVSGLEQTARNLSGGNQQKVVLAKWLAIQPKVLILDEPTRGIDVAAKAEVHRIIARLADSGVAILLISSELPELLKLADRVAVMHQGRLTADFPRALATEEAIMKTAVAEPG